MNKLNKMSNNTHKIYGLRVVGTKEVRYIGYTKRKLETRLYYHLYDAKAGHTYRKCNWIRKNNYNIEIVLLLDNLTLEKALEKEVEYISKYYNLVNMTKGGEQNPMNNIEVRNKHRISMNNRDKSKCSHFGKDNWMTTDEGRKWFSENNPMNNRDSYNKSQIHNIKNRKLLDYDILYYLYIIKNTKAKDIAIILETTYKSVTRNLTRLGIKKYK